MPHSNHPHRIALLIALLGLGVATLGSTCVVIEEGPYGGYEDPGINADEMEQQEEEVRGD